MVVDVSTLRGLRITGLGNALNEDSGCGSCILFVEG